MTFVLHHIADLTKAIKVLGWKPAYADLVTIVVHVWAWECRNEK
jgi:hypothetical protein